MNSQRNQMEPIRESTTATRLIEPHEENFRTQRRNRRRYPPIEGREVSKLTVQTTPSHPILQTSVEALPLPNR